MKTILCAVDMSGETDIIVEKAVSLAEQLNAKVLLVTVIEKGLIPKDYQKALEAEVFPKFEELGDKYSISKKKRHIVFGKSYDSICNLASEKKADLIVLGSHAKRGLQALVGSTANGVMHRAPCDIYLVKMY